MKRGGELAAEQGLGNCSFQVMDALHMDFPDDTFDLVWACESGEHMPDKKKVHRGNDKSPETGYTATPDACHACMQLPGPSIWFVGFT